MALGSKKYLVTRDFELLILKNILVLHSSNNPKENEKILAH
jgi:hypothetical protein